jgi:hypothetical protein
MIQLAIFGNKKIEEKLSYLIDEQYLRGWAKN